jgi:hypothetical protein
MAQQKPKKPKSKKLNLSSKAKWKNILKDIDKKEVPIQVLEKLVVNLIDGTAVIIDIKQILSDGADPNSIEDHVNERLTDLDDYIKNVDFFVNLDEVKKTVQPETDKILSKL